MFQLILWHFKNAMSRKSSQHEYAPVWGLLFVWTAHPLIASHQNTAAHFLLGYIWLPIPPVPREALLELGINSKTGTVLNNFSGGFKQNIKILWYTNHNIHCLEFRIVCTLYTLWSLSSLRRFYWRVKCMCYIGR